MAPQVCIIGPGRLGAAMARALHAAGVLVPEMVALAPAAHRKLAREVGAKLHTLADAQLDANVLWVCVPDAALADVARDLARGRDLRRRVALHSSGALPGDVLAPMRAKGAAVGSLHPMMTFARNSVPSLQGVSFAVEGDAAALRQARAITATLGGRVFRIAKERKPLYHAMGAFVSPLLVAQLAMAEEVGAAAGLPRREVARIVAPILRRTVDNYINGGAAAAFTGPLVRGDLGTIRMHLKVLREVPGALELYRALAEVALEKLPVAKREEVRALFQPRR